MIDFDYGPQFDEEPTTRCDDCGEPVHLDPNGFWVDEDETSDCDEVEIGHRVNGAAWG